MLSDFRFPIKLRRLWVPTSPISLHKQKKLRFFWFFFTIFQKWCIKLFCIVKNKKVTAVDKSGDWRKLASMPELNWEPGVREQFFADLWFSPIFPLAQLISFKSKRLTSMAGWVDMEWPFLVYNKIKCVTVALMAFCFVNCTCLRNVGQNSNYVSTNKYNVKNYC